MDLSVVIPTYNERKRLPATIKEVAEFLSRQRREAEIIVSDSGSSDGTAEFVEQFARSSPVPVKFVRGEHKEGKGAGVKRGVLASSGKAVIFMDADNSTRILEIRKLEPFLREAQVLIGSRYIGVEAKVKQGIIRRLISRLGAVMIRLLTGLKVRDTQCGFKLFDGAAGRRIFGELETKGWGFDVEVLLLAKRFGYKIKEVAVEWQDAEGSHLSATRDALKTFLEVIAIKRRLRKFRASNFPKR